MIKEIGKKQYVLIICQKLEQPIGTLYTANLDWKTLHHIAFADTRVFQGYDDEGKEVYRGIQRILSSERQKEIKKYISEFEYATFPSSIILNFPHEKIDLIDIESKIEKLLINSRDDSNNVEAIDWVERDFRKIDQCLLVFPFEKSIAQIIDGQHRLSGFQPEDQIVFDLPITIFIDQSVENQAEIFSTINGKQTRVTPSLVYELFGITDRKSPYKTVHEITKILNESDTSPLKKWIKRLGKSTDYYEGFITQSTINRNLFILISGNAKQADEDMRILAQSKKLTMDTPFSKKNPPLRKYFLDDREEIIAQVIINFYTALSKRFRGEWNSKNSIFQRTIGFNAMFKVMIDMIRLGVIKDDFSEDFFLEELNDIKDIDFKVQLSSKGVNELYNQFYRKYSVELRNAI